MDKRKSSSEIKLDYNSLTLSILQFLIGIYLIIVVLKGKTADLLAFIRNCKDFGVYIVAWIVIVAVYEFSKFNKTVFEIVNMFIPLFVVGYLLFTYENIFAEYNKLMTTLKGGKTL